MKELRRINLVVDLKKRTVSETPDDTPIESGDSVTWTIAGAKVDNITLEFRDSKGSNLKGPFAALRAVSESNSIEGEDVADRQFKYVVLESGKALRWANGKNGANIPRTSGRPPGQP